MHSEPRLSLTVETERGSRRILLYQLHMLLRSFSRRRPIRLLTPC